MEISVVVPVYNCDACLSELCYRLHKHLTAHRLTYEIILVNDEIDDMSWATIRRLSKKSPFIKGIRLSKNFGQHNAVTAGVEASLGKWIVVMDCDLQDVPEDIYKMYTTARKGYDIVFTKRVNRKDRFLKKLFSRGFSYLFEKLTDMKSDPSIGNFTICSRQVAQNFRLLQEQNRSYLQALRWMGFKNTAIPVTHARRYKGNSSYTMAQSVSFAVNSLTAYSYKPLVLSIRFGFIIALISFLAGIYLIFRYFIMKISIVGWTSLVVSIFFAFGLIIANLGILGIYIGKIFDETKKRPLYIIKESIGFPRTHHSKHS